MQMAPTLPTNFSLDLFVTLVFLVIAALYILFSVVFYYHWVTYGTDKKITSLTFLLYAGSTLTIFFFLGIMTFFI